MIWMLPERLEDRCFLSAVVGASLAGAVDGEYAAAALTIEPRAAKTVRRMPRLGDVFKGTSKWRESGKIVSVRITMRVTRAKSGEYRVSGTSADDRSARYTYSVHMARSGSFTFEFSGRNMNGTDQGSGSGRLSTNGKTLSGKNTSSQNPSMVSFSLTLR